MARIFRVEKARSGRRSNAGRSWVLPDGTRVTVYVIDEPDGPLDRWTAVLESADWDSSVNRGMKAMLGMSDNPEHFSQFTAGMKGPHLGRRVQWVDVPEKLRQHIARRVSRSGD